MSLTTITVEFLLQYVLVFMRIGAIFSQLPGLSSRYIPNHVRLVTALAVTLLIYPLVKTHLPSYPMHTGHFIRYMVIEFLLGITISLAARVYFSMLDVVGSIISLQSGLSAAMFFNPAQNIQASVISNLLFLFATCAIFVTDTHYVFIDAAIESYQIFQVGSLPNLGDLSSHIANTINQSFILAFKLSAPFLAVSLGILVSGGVLARLMPSLQVFFVITPVQMWIIFIILWLVVNNIVSKVIENLQMAVKFSI